MRSANYFSWIIYLCYLCEYVVIIGGIFTLFGMLLCKGIFQYSVNCSSKQSFGLLAQEEDRRRVVLKIDTTDSNEIPFLNGGITQKSFRKWPQNAKQQPRWQKSTVQCANWRSSVHFYDSKLLTNNLNRNFIVAKKIFLTILHFQSYFFGKIPIWRSKKKTFFGQPTSGQENL